MTAADLDRVQTLAGSLPEAPQWTRQAYEAATDPESLPRRLALIAEQADGELAAFAIAVVFPPQAELETIAVAPQLQRRGIARQLLSLLIAKLKEAGVTEVMLEVRESNRAARNLYAATGFVVTGLRSSYYVEPREDAILMTLFERPPADKSGP